MLYFLLAAIGVVLLLPTGTKKTSEETEQPQETAVRPAGDAGLSVQEEMEQRLCDALSQMDGVGAVHVVEEMIRLYCRKNHGKEGHASGGMCPECQKLADYAKQRSQKCPFMEQKTFCANCKVHCYKPEMREKIRAVMRFSGPRMLLYHPILAIWHLICSMREKRKAKA